MTSSAEIGGETPRPAPTPTPSPALPKVALGTLVGLLVAELALHLFAIGQYGYFRDELYYLASTGHLTWGYVEHPPLSIAILALVRSLLGDSLPALRLVPLLAGMATIWVTVLLARELGGGRVAQALSGLACLLSPVFLGTDHYYSMNAIDLLLWAVAAWLILRALRRGHRRDWIALGIVLGLGLLNKISMLWLEGGFFAALLLTRHRRLLVSPGPWIAALISLVLFAPHLVWQAQHGWPTLEFMRNATSLKMAPTSPADFLVHQILDMNPGSAPLWIAGLFFGLLALRGQGGQVLAWIYVAVLTILLAQGHARSSYLAVAYPMLLALGGVAIEHFVSLPGRRWVVPALAGLILVLGLVALPMALPILPVRTFVRYQAALGLAPRTEERQTMGVLPQQYADMFGWEGMVQLVKRAYDRLSPEERARCRVFGQNYGEAGAIDVLGRRLGLPPALSGHNSYWLWGPGTKDWDVLIIIGGDPDDNAVFFDDIEIVGQTASQWSMPYERGINVSIARRPRISIERAWPELKRYI